MVEKCLFLSKIRMYFGVVFLTTWLKQGLKKRSRLGYVSFYPIFRGLHTDYFFFFTEDIFIVFVMSRLLVIPGLRSNTTTLQ